MALSSCILMLFERKVRPVCRVLTWVLLGLVGGRMAVAAERTLWTADWRFAAGAEAPPAAQWTTVRLPHDWSAHLPPLADAPSEGHGGFAQAGIGWYEKRFAVLPAWQGQRVEVLFEGVYMDADLWCNGAHVGRQVNGYLPWRVDLTEHLRAEGENVVRVRVNNAAQPNARWYTGSGIYRPVWLEVSAPVHLVPDSGVSNTRRLSAEAATLALAVEVNNGGAEDAVVKVVWTVQDPSGTTVAAAARAVALPPGGTATVPATVTIADPQAWSPDTPRLYRVKATVELGGREMDRVEWSTGLRTIAVSVERGFELNGEPLKLLGGNVHSDHGLLGAMSLARAEERKVALLKAAGFNAVRTAHNPPASAFLEACDRLGLLVVDEIYDDWVKKKTKQAYGRFLAEAWPEDIATWVRRDRRHPSVVMWSTGNEMYERANASGRELAMALATRVRRFDGSRPVTAGVNGLGVNGDWTKLDGLFATFDVAGYNYELAHHETDHARLPERVMFASESYQHEAYVNWAIMREAPYVIGDFVWSAQDYLGESGIGRVYPSGEEPRKHWEGSHWPWRGAYCGDLDLIGWRKPISHYRQIVWDRGERLYVAVEVPSPDGQPWQLTPWSITPELPSWTWPGREGQALTVNVYSRWPRVRVELNGAVVGEAATGEAEAFRAALAVPYVPGELVAIGLNAAGAEQERRVLSTAGPMADLRLTVDRTELRADGDDLAYVEIEAVDAADRWLSEDTRAVRVTVEGPADLVALGSGDPTAAGVYTTPERKLWLGRLLAVVRMTDEPGEIRVHVSADGVPERVVVLRSR